MHVKAARHIICCYINFVQIKLYGIVGMSKAISTTRSKVQHVIIIMSYNIDVKRYYNRFNALMPNTSKVTETTLLKTLTHTIITTNVPALYTH